MSEIKNLFIIIIIVLILPFTIFGQTNKNDKKVETENFQVLEERIEQIEKNINNQIKSLEKQTDDQEKHLVRELEIRAEEQKERMNLYLWFAGALITFILGVFSFLAYFLGNIFVIDWIKKQIDTKIDKYIKKEDIEEKVIQKGEDAVKKSLLELEKKAKERLIEIENIKDDYFTTLKSLKEKFKDVSIDKPIPEESKKNLNEFEETLPKLKSESEYSFDDWFYKGIYESSSGNHEIAIKYYTNALEIKPDSFWAYSNRGNAYGRLYKYDEAIRDLNKAIELNPRVDLFYGNRGCAYLESGKYDEASKDFMKAVEINKESVKNLENICELKIIIGDYDSALEYNDKALIKAIHIEDKVICLYLKCIAMKLNDTDTTLIEEKLNKLLKKDFALYYSFVSIENLLKEADISEDKKEFIKEKTKLLKKKKK